MIVKSYRFVPGGFGRGDRKMQASRSTTGEFTQENCFLGFAVASALYQIAQIFQPVPLCLHFLNDNLLEPKNAPARWEAKVNWVRRGQPEKTLSL